MIDKLSQPVRLIIACLLSTAVIILWQTFYVEPMLQAQQQQSAAPIDHNKVNISANEVVAFQTRDDAMTQHQDLRVSIENNLLKGSINLVGARIDDIILKSYKLDLSPDSKNIPLLSPASTREAYFAEIGWLNVGENATELPDKNTIWGADKKKLIAGDKITLSWKNTQGINFIIEVSLDDDYMFTIKQIIDNQSMGEINIRDYTLLSRTAEAQESTAIIHEGGIGVLDGKLEEISFEDISSKQKIEFKTSPSWVGFSDKYWLAALIPDKGSKAQAKFSHVAHKKLDRYQVSIANTPFAISPREKHSQTFKFFAGAKEIDLLDKYEQEFSISLFDRAVDFGILYFITKPTLKLLHYFYGMCGNFGVAILLLTVFVKILLFPLARKGYLGMNRLKDLQPKVAELKERNGKDPMAFQRELVQLYKKEGVSPMSGCLPILLQIPVFFALYKVLYVSIEMRQAPFIWWVKDLSAPDTTNIFTAFGLIPWDPPSFLMIGILPVMMSFTMYLQQKMSPEPADPMQATMMRWLPVILLFMFASFPSGLVIYWTWSNILSIFQQYFLKKAEAGKAKPKFIAHKKVKKG